MNELQNLYEKINPKDAPETMAERIIARSEAEKNSAKTRGSGRFAVAACIAAALIVAVPVTASAMIGSNIFEVFKSYFNTQELDSVSIVEYYKVIEPDGKTDEPGGKTDGQDGEITEADDRIFESSDYKVTVNGLAADKHCVYISYDIEYKAPSCFENYEDGELRQELLEWSPVIFRVEPQEAYRNGGGSGGGGRPVSVDGATVSYVSFATCSNSFLERPSMDNYRVKIKYSCGSVDSDGVETDGVFNASIPATKDITLTINEEITCTDGREGILNKIELNSLSIYFFMTTKEEEQRIDVDLYAPKLFFKDGTVLDLAEDPESIVGGCGGSHPAGQDVKRYYYYLYGTVIDPETIEAVEILGKTYAVKKSIDHADNVH